MSPEANLPVRPKWIRMNLPKREELSFLVVFYWSKMDFGLSSHVGKVGCVIPMVVISILPHVNFGLNDHRKDTPHFTVLKDSENHLGSLWKMNQCVAVDQFWSFLTDSLALPKASIAGLAATIWSSRVPPPFNAGAPSPPSFLAPNAATTAKYWMTLLVLTVLPAPDSPEKLRSIQGHFKVISKWFKSHFKVISR